MDLTKVLLFLLVAFAALQFGLLPLFRARLKLEFRTGKPLRVGLLAILEHLRKYVATALVVYASVWLVLQITNGDPATPDAMNRLLRKIDAISVAFKPFTEWWVRLAAVLSFLILATLSMRWLSTGFYDYIRDEIDRLLHARDNKSAEWKTLTPTKEMEEETSSLKKLQRKRDKIAANTGYEGDLQRLDEQIKDQQSLILLLDTLRRIDLAPENSAAPSGFWGRGRQLLFSKGLLSDVKGVSKVLSYGTRVLLCLSLLSVSATGIVEGLALRQLHVEQLKVNLDLNKARKEHARNVGFQDPSSPEETKRAIAYSARALETAVLSNNDWRPSMSSARPAHNLEAEADWVRISVRQQLSVPNRTSEASSQPSKDTHPKPDGNELGLEFVKSIPSEGPRTRLGRYFEKYLTTTGTGPEKQAAVTAYRKHLQSYATTDDYLDLQSWAVGEAFGSVVELAIPEVDNEAGKELLGSLSHFSEDFFKAYFDLARNRFMASLIDGDAYDVAADNVRATTSKLRGTRIASESLDSLLATLDDSRGQIRSALLTSTAQELEQAPEALASDVNELTKKLNDRTKELFKSNPNAADDFRTSISDATQEFASQYPLAESVNEKNDAERAARAADFLSVTRDRHTGGIVIGRTSKNGEIAEVKDIRWEIKGTTVALWLVRADGTLIQIGTFPAVLARQALLYASDRRPLAITVENSTAIARRKVLLHPALQGTNLGCRFINADHLIFDTLTPKGKSTDVSKAVRQIQLQASLYNKAVEWVSAPYTHEKMDLSEEQVSAALAIGDKAQPSPLVGLRQDFNQDLVNAMHKCAIGKAEATYDSCVVQRFSSSSKLSRIGTHVSSQIQELEFSPDPDLQFLLHPRSQSTAWPLRMDIQMTANSEHVWELQGFVPDVEARFLNELGPDHISEIEELKEFALIQRLFRSGYSGGLGPSFNIGHLAQLAFALREITPAKVATPSWSSDTPQRDFLEREIKNIAASIKQSANSESVLEFPQKFEVMSDMDRCVVRIENIARPDLLSNEELHTACPLTRLIRSDSPLAMEIDQLFDLRELRVKLAAADVPERPTCQPVGVY